MGWKCQSAGVQTPGWGSENKVWILSICFCEEKSSFDDGCTKQLIPTDWYCKQPRSEWACPESSSVLTGCGIETLSWSASCYSVEYLCWACISQVTIVTACQTWGGGTIHFLQSLSMVCHFPCKCGCSFLCCYLSTVSYLLPLPWSCQWDWEWMANGDLWVNWLYGVFFAWA